jgi:hypothetical protein
MTGSPVSPSGVSSLKAIFSILMGLSVTNTLVVLIKSNGEGSITPFADLDPLHLVFAGVLLFTIARFYLGNVRHVDDFYVNASVDGVPLDPHATSASRFALDFTVLLIEALMFSLASFYIVHPTNFIEIVMALLVIDILWTTSASADAPHSWFWLRNNLVHVLLIAVCFGFHLKYETSLLPFYFAIGLLLTNGLIDMVWNRGFYFADRGHEKTIFLSAPFTQLMIDGGLPAAVQKDLNFVIDHLEGEGWLVDNAHRREHWGTRLDSPLRAVGADLRGIEKAHILIAILGSPPSPGVQLEIGYALARNKKLVIVAEANDPMPYLIRGVVEHESVVLLRQSLGGASENEFGGALSEAFQRLTR